MKLGAVILCGGGSERMGRDKASLPFGVGQTLLGQTLGQVAAVIGEGPIFCVAAEGQPLSAISEDVTVVRDRQPDRGPLEALATGLEQIVSSADAVIVAACDAPLLRPELMRWLAAQLGDYDAVLPMVADRWQPLVAVYKPAIVEIADFLLNDGERSLMGLLEELYTLDVPEGEIRKHDPELRSFLNCNDEAAYERALSLHNQKNVGR